MKLYDLVKNVVSNNTSLPMLKFAMVQKKKLYVTDLDNCLVLNNTDLGDGFHVLDLLKHEIDQPQDCYTLDEFPNFPVRFKAKKFKLPVYIFNDQFEYFVEANSNRGLGGVFFGADGGVVSTDGHIMQSQENVVKVPEDFVLPVQSYLMIKNFIKEFKIENEIECHFSYKEIRGLIPPGFV